VRKSISIIITVAAVGLLAGTAVTTSAERVGTSKLGKIKGESTDKSHKDWVEVERKVQHPDLTITKRVDRASPKLLSAGGNAGGTAPSTLDKKHIGGVKY